MDTSSNIMRESPPSGHEAKSRTDNLPDIGNGSDRMAQSSVPSISRMLNLLVSGKPIILKARITCRAMY